MGLLFDSGMIYGVGTFFKKNIFPRVYMLDNDKGCYVVNRISHDWSSFLRRNPRAGIEASQLLNLQNLIRDVVLSDKRDSWIW